MKTSEQWYQLIKDKVRIYDPDGWRTKDAPSWDSDLITKEEFRQRLVHCTISGEGLAGGLGELDKFLTERLV